MARPYELEVVSDETVGGGGFLTIRRLRLVNVRPDGSRSRDWLCDYVERPKGVDAVVLVLWRRQGDTSGRDGVEVLLRDGLRPALLFGRPASRLPLPDERDHLFLTELVAGIVEEGEVGEAAIARRAADEAWEEAGVRIDPATVELLGRGLFPSAGMTAERFWLAAAEVPAGTELAPPVGDGSPMEEGATVRWVPLDDALAQCDAGTIVDAKTELGLHRLARRL